MSDDFFPEIDIREDQAEAIARGLHAVAKADGTVHEREAAMITEFFNSTTDHASHLAALERQPKLDPQHLAAVLGTKELRQLFIKTALLLAYVDGVCTPQESQQISEYARACELDEAAVANLEAAVKDYLLGHLSHLQNIAGVAAVATDLKR